MYNKDFNILGLKIDSSNNKKDISFVTDINSYVQKIENICRLQKGEIPSSSNLGIDYYSFIFDPVSYKVTTENDISIAIQAGIAEVSKVKTKIVYYDDQKIILNVTFTAGNKFEKTTTTCKIEVDII